VNPNGQAIPHWCLEGCFPCGGHCLSIEQARKFSDVGADALVSHDQRLASEKVVRSSGPLIPMGSPIHRGFWYTIGYCHLRQGERLFRLDRITHLKMTSETFPPPLNFSTLQAIQQALASVPRTWQVEVWLHTTLPEAERQMRLIRSKMSEQEFGPLTPLLI
jgi:hypothetical protein